MVSPPQRGGALGLVRSAQSRAARLTLSQKPQWCCWLIVAALLRTLSPAGIRLIRSSLRRVNRVQSGVPGAFGFPLRAYPTASSVNCAASAA